MIAPVPQTERGRPVSFDVTKEFIIYTHGKSVYWRPVVVATSNAKSSKEFTNPYNTSAVRVSPQGDRIAIGDVNGNLRIITMNEERICKFEGRLLASRICDIVWNEDGKYVAVTGEGRGMYAAVINSETGQSMGEMGGPTKSCNSISLIKDKIAIACDDFMVAFYTGPPFRLTKTLKNHGRFVSAVSFSPDNKLLATAGGDSKIFIYDANQGELQFELTSECNEKMNCSILGISWSLDSKALFSCSTDGIIRKWSLNEKMVKKSSSFGQQIMGIKTLEDRGLLAILLNGSIVELDDDLNLLNMTIGHSKNVSDLIVDDNGKIIYSSDNSGCIANWIDNTIITTNSDSVGISAMHRLNGCPIAVLGLSNKVFNIESKSFTTTDLPSNTLMTLSNEKYLIAITENTLTTQDGNGVIKSKMSLDESLTTACIRGNSLYYSTRSSSLKKVNIGDNGELVMDEFCFRLPMVTNGTITCLVESPDNRYLAIGDNQRRIHLFDLSSSTMIATKWCFHTSVISCLAWSLDGKYLVSGGLDNAILIWDPAILTKPSREIRNAHAGTIQLIKFATNTQFYSCGGDAAIRSWSLF